MISSFHDILDILEDMYGHFGPTFKPTAVEISRKLYSECQKNANHSARYSHGPGMGGFHVVKLMCTYANTNVEVKPSKDIEDDDVYVYVEGVETKYSYKEWFLSKLAEDILLKGKDEDLVDRRSSLEDFPV